MLYLKDVDEIYQIIEGATSKKAKKAQAKKQQPVKNQTPAKTPDTSASLSKLKEDEFEKTIQQFRRRLETEQLRSRHPKQRLVPNVDEHWLKRLRDQLTSSDKENSVVT